MQAQMEKLMPSLVYVQTHLDGDLSLENVAATGNLSPYHFHRLFQDTTGETLKQYTQRLRLERAAYQLKIRDDAILNIALNNGYKNHETFSRAFKRWFGVSPRQYRESYGRILQSAPGQEKLNKWTQQYTLSAITLQTLAPVPLAFIRHLGAYTAVNTNRFDDLLHWADIQGLYTGDNQFIGIGHDDPNITPTHQVRFDMCLTVPERFLPVGDIGCQDLPGGTHATASYVGPFGPTLEQALGELFLQIAHRTDLELLGLPLIEIYRSTRINPDYALNHTDIYVPVRRKS